MLASAGSWVLVTSFLPFVIVFGFMALATRTARARLQKAQEPYLAKLEEIRAELERLRKTMERRDEDSGFGFRS
jgi:hypothetical protein